MSLDVLLISSQMIKERSAIHGNIDDKLIYPDIKLVQDKMIHPILGTALFNKLQSEISAGTLGGNYKILLDKYIVDALVYYVLSELPTSISFQFWNKGVIRKQNEGSELASMTDLMDLANRYKDNAEWYGKRLILYLRQNANLFPEYRNPGSGVDTIFPDNDSFTMPLYLDDEYECVQPYKPYGQ